MHFLYHFSGNIWFGVPAEDGFQCYPSTGTFNVNYDNKPKYIYNESWFNVRRGLSYLEYLQVTQLSQRDCAVGWVISFGQK